MNRNYTLFLLFCFLICFSRPLYSQDNLGSANPDVVRLVREGVDLHNKKDYTGAIKILEEAVSIEPNNVLVRENLSIIHNNYGKYLFDRTDYEKATKEFRQAIYYDFKNSTADANLNDVLKQRGVKATDPQARAQLGDKLRTEANFEHALIEYQKALNLSKAPEPSLLISIGDIYYILYLRGGQQTNDINKANEYYNKALQIKETARAHIKVGDSLLALKDIVGAIENYRKAIQLEPESQEAITANMRGWNEAVRLAPLVPENHIGLATALQLKKDFINSEEEYNQALKLDPENQSALKGLESLKADRLKAQASGFLDAALKLQSESKFDEAINQYIKALEITPKDSKLHYNIGTAFQAKGDYEYAGKAYKKTLALDPNYEKAKTAIEILTKQSNDKKVKELTDRALELQNAGNYQEAVTSYLAALSVTPDDPSLHYNLGTAYQASGDFSNAQKEYEKASALDKTNQAYITAVKAVKIEIANPIIQGAINKQSSGDNAGAIADYLKALELIPDDAQTHFNLATAYQANNQSDLAIQSYQKALQLDSKGQSDAYFFLGALYEEKHVNKTAIENYQKYIQAAPAGSYVKDAKDRMAYLKTLKQ